MGLRSCSKDRVSPLLCSALTGLPSRRPASWKRPQGNLLTPPLSQVHGFATHKPARPKQHLTLSSSVAQKQSSWSLRTLIEVSFSIPAATMTPLEPPRGAGSNLFTSRLPLPRPPATHTASVLKKSGCLLSRVKYKRQRKSAEGFSQFGFKLFFLTSSRPARRARLTPGYESFPETSSVPSQMLFSFPRFSLFSL